jgi:large subunit ribosomal protein L18
VKSLNAQDKVLFSVNTKILTNFGWPKDKLGSLKSISASYLAGYLIGKKSKIDSRIILDSGIIPSTTGSRIYACVKGVSDAGLDIKFDKEIAPSEERIRGTNLKSELGKEFDKIKSEIDKSKF